MQVLEWHSKLRLVVTLFLLLSQISYASFQLLNI